MKKLLFVSLALLVLGVSLAEAQTIKEVDIPQKIYDYVEFPPHFPGGVKMGMQRTLAQNFVYPDEAWQSSRVKQAEVNFIVRRDGTVTSVIVEGDLHPALVAELQRVIPKMPLWYPAYKSGQKIDARVGVVVNLVEQRTGLPYHLQTAAKSLERYTAHSYTPRPMTRQQMEQAVAELGVIGDVYLEYKPTAIAINRLRASLGDVEQAAVQMDRSAREYEHLNPYRQVDGAPAILGFRPGYCGKDDVAMQLQRAVAYDLAGREATARRAYDKVLQLAETKIKTGDIGLPVDAEDESLRFLQTEDLMDKMFYRLTYIDSDQLTPEDQTRLATVQRTPQNIIPIIEDLIASGRLKDVKVAQQKDQIKQMLNETAHGKVDKGDQGRLYAVEVLAVCLRDGVDAASEYVARRLAEGGLRGAGKAQLTKVQKQLRAHAAELADHSLLVRVVGTYGPVIGDAGADAYYRAAEALNDVFPMAWLTE